MKKLTKYSQVSNGKYGMHTNDTLETIENDQLRGQGYNEVKGVGK